MSRSKSQGTAFETWLVGQFKEAGMYSRRIPEGGALDEGDLEVVTTNGLGFTVEAKAREVLNVTRELGKARAKAHDAIWTALAWKRLVKPKGDGKRRVPDGEKVVVVIGFDTFKLLLSMAGRANNGH